MRVRTLLVLIPLVAPACAGDRPAAAEDDARFVHDDAIGLSFLVPMTWQWQREATPYGAALVLSGAPASPAYNATLILQVIPDAGESFEDVVDDAVAPLANLPHFRFLGETPRVVATHVGMQYGVEVELHESLRLRHAVLLPHDGLWIDIACSAIPEILPDAVAALETALDSAIFTPVTRE
jgi:hypothetical protein